jgi:hypothetical protein
MNIWDDLFLLQHKRNLDQTRQETATLSMAYVGFNTPNPIIRN